jgi:hypothetical protein
MSISIELSNKRLKLPTQPTAFVCKATIKDAIKGNGVRGNVFKYLQMHHAFYSEKEGIQTRFEGDNLSIQAYFEEKNKALDFQNVLADWNMKKELFGLEGVVVDPINPLEVSRPLDLVRIRLEDYIAKDCESHPG